MTKRWRVVLATFVLSLGGIAALYLSIPTRYTSSAVLVFSTPLNGGTVSKGRLSTSQTNPLLNFQDGLKTTSLMLIRELNTPEAMAQLRAGEVADTTLEVTNGSANVELLDSGPFVFIEGESTSPAGAQNVVARAAAMAHQQLVDVEAGLKVPSKAYIVLADVVPSTPPQALQSGKGRAVAAGLAVGAILSLLSAFIVESIADGRRQRCSFAPAAPILPSGTSLVPSALPARPARQRQSEVSTSGRRS